MLHLSVPHEFDIDLMLYNSAFAASCFEIPILCLIHFKASAFMEAPSFSAMPDNRVICFSSSSFDLLDHLPMNVFCCSVHPVEVSFTSHKDTPPISSTYCCMYSSFGPSSSHIAWLV